MLPEQVVKAISKVVKQRKVDSSSFGPLCHLLKRLVASDHKTVAVYAARSLKLLVLDDALRPQATRAGVTRALVESLEKHQGDTACMREVLG